MGAGGLVSPRGANGYGESVAGILGSEVRVGRTASGQVSSTGVAPFTGFICDKRYA